MKKRIVFYGIKTFPSQGGTDRVAENIAYQLRDTFDITIYCFKNEGKEVGRFDGIRVVEFKRRAKGAFGVFIYFLESALHLFFSQKLNLIHVHKTEATFFVPFFRIKYKVVSTSHEAQYKSDKWGWFAKVYFHLVERIFIKSSSACTTISKPLAEYYEKKYNRKVRFLPNGINPVDRNSFDLERMRSFIPEGASIDKPFILFSARRLMSIKGCHTMLEALKAIGYDGQIFITGELHPSDPYLSRLRNLSEGLNVHFLGFVNPLSALLPLVDKSDFFVFPSETEGMSIMLLEVASLGKPIIASDIPENMQVFSNDEVLYFRSKDAHDLADKIKFALQNKEAMDGMGTKCQRKVYSEYQWDKIAMKYAELYYSVMS